MWQMMTNRVVMMLLVVMLASGWCCGLMGQMGKTVYAGAQANAKVVKGNEGGNTGGHECCGDEEGKAAKKSGGEEKGKEDSKQCPCEHVGGYTHTQAMEGVYAGGVMMLEKVADCLLTGMMVGEGYVGGAESEAGGTCCEADGGESWARYGTSLVYQHCLLLI